MADVNLMALKYEPGEVPLSGCEAELNNQQSRMAAICDANNLVSPILKRECPSWIWMSQLDELLLPQPL
jgi:hypothetical protein